MSRFTKSNFEKIIKELELVEEEQGNIWLPIGILEIMYDDDYGYIDDYFHTHPRNLRDIDKLWINLQSHIKLIEKIKFLTE